MFCDGGPVLSLVSRACFGVACFVGAWSCAPVFWATPFFGLHVFCECFVIAKANANANAMSQSDPERVRVTRSQLKV